MHITQLNSLINTTNYSYSIQLITLIQYTQSHIHIYVHRPKAVVRIFGSQMTKILTPSSDLDIAVLEVPEGDMTTTDLLYDLEKAILSKG